MGVFSYLSRDALASAVVGWGHGMLVDAEPTPLGIENSNYFVTTEDAYGDVREWVLTVMPEAPTPEALTVLERLARARLPVAAPVRDLDGRQVGRVDGHPALLAPRLAGRHPERPDAAQCRAIGDFLGRMHRISRGLHGPGHPRDLAWLETGFAEHAQGLGFSARQLLRIAIDSIASSERRADWRRMPVGVVHGDLFRDNALFEGSELRGVIDFHHAARAPLAFDLAVVAMDWCSDGGGRLDGELTHELIAAYARQRPLVREELWFWPELLVLACTRFFVARLHSPRKPPEEMAARLSDRLARPMYLHPDLLPQAA